MKPLAMPMLSFSTFATGDRQFVVQLAFDTTRSSAVSVSSFTPKTMVLSALSPGAEISTRLAPVERCGWTFSLDAKMPVHSMITSTSPQGRSAGLRMAVTLIGYGCRETAMHAVIAQQMRIGFDRTQVVDRNHLDIGAARFDDRAQHVAPNAPEPVDRNFDSHGSLSRPSDVGPSYRAVRGDANAQWRLCYGDMIRAGMLAPEAEVVDEIVHRTGRQQR